MKQSPISVLWDQESNAEVENPCEDGPKLYMESDRRCRVAEHDEGAQNSEYSILDELIHAL
jgi:hypothetical protein